MKKVRVRVRFKKRTTPARNFARRIGLNPTYVLIQGLRRIMVQKISWNSKILPLQAPCWKLVVRIFSKIFYLNYQKVTYNNLLPFWMNFYENILLSKCWGIQGLVQSKVDGPEIQKWRYLGMKAENRCNWVVMEFKIRCFDR